MQSEEFDNKVKKAADHHHPAYDEQAWDKMEQLLDKHLPQEKDDRRRFIFFLLLFLLLGGSAWLVATKPWAGNKASIAQIKEKDDISSNQKPIGNIKDDGKGDTKINTSTSDKNEIEKPVTTVAGITEKPELSIGTYEPAITSNNPSSVPGTTAVMKKINKSLTTSIASTKQRTTIFAEVAGVKKRKVKQNIIPTDSDDKKRDETKSEPQQQTDNAITTPIVKTDISATVKTNTDINQVISNNKDVPVEDSSVAKKDSPVTDTAKTNEPVVENPAVAQKAKNKKSNSFFFSLSTGPDVSFAGGNKMGKAKLVVGLGIGYSFKNRLTIRTGFYTGRKIYSASPAAYNPPADFYIHYPYLQKVDADCKVYEIPVLLSYNFGTSAKQNWFLSTGLSSLLMKSESYTYFYKYMATGPTLNAKWSVKDKNKHFFSVLTLSGGYQRSLSKNLTLMVEPYVKIPLSGVGYGKVKLNSTGLLFSLGIKPFNNPKKQQR